jgi:hypothetical protein
VPQAIGVGMSVGMGVGMGVGMTAGVGVEIVAGELETVTTAPIPRSTRLLLLLPVEAETGDRLSRSNS